MTAAMIPPEELACSPYPERRQGGQHVGTPSGVRVEHIPTGIVAIVMTDSSQHRNKSVAVRMIEAALTDPEFRG